MTHIVAGYPSFEANVQLALQMARSGVAYLEIQIPFSDPLADGPTIMDANQISIENGTRVEDCFALMQRLSHKFKEEKLETKLLFMTYANILLNYSSSDENSDQQTDRASKRGIPAFCERASQLGLYGLIVPDLPFHQEGHDNFLSTCQENNLHAIQVVSPITPKARLQKIIKRASGFLYCVSTTGKTGERKELDPSVISYLDQIRTLQMEQLQIESEQKYCSTSIPLALGFGISSLEMVQTALSKADIAVVGSKLIKVFQQSTRPTQTEKVEEVGEFVAHLLTPSS